MVDTATNTREPSALLETKLYIPKWRSGLVPRTRLVERLNQGTERKLTLVSVPAGLRARPESPVRRRMPIRPGW